MVPVVDNIKLEEDCISQKNWQKTEKDGEKGHEKTCQQTKQLMMGYNQHSHLWVDLQLLHEVVE